MSFSRRKPKMRIKDKHKEDTDHAGDGPYQQVFSRGNETEIVHNFIYLGSEINANGSCVREIRRRMVLAGAEMNRLCKTVFKKHDVSLSLKLRLLDACVMSITHSHGSARVL